MNASKIPFLADRFSHIYVEDAALSYPLTQKILAARQDAVTVLIRHYKDLFNRSGQNFLLQKKTTPLILAVKTNTFVYPGARVCQRFGYDRFYYASSVCNCIYDCEYCYLQGMYPSGSMVVFVNIEDYFSCIDRMLKEHPLYLCISYDTDLLAIEGLTGLVGTWCAYALQRPGLTIEIRTKSAFDVRTLSLPPANRNPDASGLNRIIFAWTLSPDPVAARYEHGAPPLSSRIAAINRALENGCTVRLCFDPMIAVKDYRKEYETMYEQVFSQIDAARIFDVGIGVFRISASYINSMREKRSCAITQYPYVNTDGICSYEPKKSREMLDFARSTLQRYIPADKIYDS